MHFQKLMLVFALLFATGLAFTIGERPRHVEIAGAAAVAAGAVLMAWPP